MVCVDEVDLVGQPAERERGDHDDEHPDQLQKGDILSNYVDVVLVIVGRLREGCIGNGGRP